MRRTTSPDDVNAIVAGYLRDLAFVQSSKPKMFGYKRAAAAVLALEEPLTGLRRSDGGFARIPGLGPGSLRIVSEVLDSGASTSVEQAIDASVRRADVDRRRELRRHFLSRAEVLRILRTPAPGGPSREDYGGDFQMHSEWSDGAPGLEEIGDACIERGYRFTAVTDHSYGLKIAGGMSMAEAADQRRVIDSLNERFGSRFRLLQGIEANIGPDGALDLSGEEAARFELVLAAPHSQLRKAHDQTARMVAAVENPVVHILAHPRGRISESRAGVQADWDAVFRAAARTGVAIEIDGDPARQDVDYVLATRALAAGCLFALDSDAHTTDQLRYAETAIAHARLAGIPSDRIVNCWSLDRLLEWIQRRTDESRGAPECGGSGGWR